MATKDTSPHPNTPQTSPPTGARATTESETGSRHPFARPLRRCRYRHVIPEGQWSCAYRHPAVLDEEQGKIGYLDIETTNLTADFGLTLSWALKPQGAMTVTSRSLARRSLEAERDLLSALLEELRGYAWVITYYGTRFDAPFLRSRCLKHRLPFPAYGQIRHLDLYYVARARLRLRSNRLRVVADFLGIPGKTDVDSAIWALASLADSDEAFHRALEAIREHNEWDVRVLEEVHARLDPYIKLTRRSL